MTGLVETLAKCKTAILSSLLARDRKVSDFGCDFYESKNFTLIDSIIDAIHVVNVSQHAPNEKLK